MAWTPAAGSLSDGTVANDLVSIFLLSLLAMFNPSLLAAVTVMLLLPNPKRLMAGYLLGAYTVSITAGLIIVFAVPHTSGESTSKHRISPVEDIVIGLLLWTLAWILRAGLDQPLQRRRQARKDAKLEAARQAGKPTESLPLRLLGKGDPRITFVVGALLSFPGVSYLDALDHIRHLNPGVVATVLLVLYFCLMQQIFLEAPLLGFLFAPEATQDRVSRFRGWMARSGRGAAVVGCAVIGLLIIVRGVVTL
jgi:Sap, sulfolipid-1-addressing protein